MNTENAIRYITPADTKGLQSLVAKAIASYGKARVAVQVAAIAILCHAAKHNDYSQASALVLGMGKTKTARDLAVFFRDFGGLSVKKAADGEEKPEGFNAWQGPDHIVAKLDEAKATMFWLYKQPKDDTFAEYSLEDMARQFISRHEKAAKAAADGKATLNDSLSEVTMQAVLKLVKFEKLANKAQPEAKAA